MKKFLYFSLLFLGSICFAQNTIVRYENTHRYHGPKSISFLVFNNQESFDIESFLKLYPTFEDLLKDNSFVRNEHFIRNIKKDSIYSNTFYGINSIPTKGFFAYRDNVEQIKWKISKKTSKILGYKCSLATAKFRGRNYVVWFTSEIPAPLGPWKLGGLPGLILKANVDDAFFTFTATNITLNSNLKVPLKYYAIYKKEKDNLIPYKKAVAVENQYYKNVKQTMADKFSTDEDSTPVRNTLIEKSFEWTEK